MESAPVFAFDPQHVGIADLADRPSLTAAAPLLSSRACAPGESQSTRIRQLIGEGLKTRQIIDVVGCQPQLVYVVKAKDKKRAARAPIETAPSGAPAESIQRSAGTAAARPEETGHRPQGSDDVPPLREVERSVVRTRPSAKHPGQSDRPTSPPDRVAEPSARSASVTYLHRPIPAPRTCQWIEGKPTPDDSCKCGAPSVRGHAYCGPHLRKAYRVLPRASVARAAS